MTKFLLILLLMPLKYGFAQTDHLSFRVSTNYLDNEPYLVQTKVVAHPKSNIDVHFFKKYFYQFYGLPDTLIRGDLKNQEVVKWQFEDRPKDLLKNWVEIHVYDAEGRLIEYRYSSCAICSQFPWGYRLLYNPNNDVVEQQIYYLEPKFYVEEGQIGTRYELKDQMHTVFKLTYDGRSIIRLEKIRKGGLEQMIELVEYPKSFEP